MDGICTAVGCEQTEIARGLCPKHYWRFRTYGTLYIDSPHDLTVEQRFWRKVAKGPTCWLWKAGRRGDGYGAFTVAGQQVAAHRYSYQLACGPIPDALVVMHSCDVPLCVNPAHLSLGTSAENAADASRKGRRLPGSKNHNAKLTEAQVLEIRTRCAAGGITHADLAHEYGISVSLVGHIHARRAWKHI